MNGRSFSFGNSGNPLVQALWMLVFALALVGAFIVGAFLLMGILGLAVITFLGFKLRGWWLQRRPRGGPGGGGSGPGRPGKEIRYIEAEYEVIDSGETPRRRREERR